jgi:hypothetical protein
MPQFTNLLVQYVGITDEKNLEVQKKGCFLWDDIHKVNKNPPHCPKVIGTHTYTHTHTHIYMHACTHEYEIK